MEKHKLLVTWLAEEVDSVAVTNTSGQAVSRWAQNDGSRILHAAERFKVQATAAKWQPIWKDRRFDNNRDRQPQTSWQLHDRLLRTTAGARLLLELRAAAG
jgi:hypothetical protein